MKKMVESYLARGYAQAVIKLRTSPAFEPVADRVEVTTANAGVFPRAKDPSRGKNTFRPLAGYPSASERLQVLGLVGSDRHSDFDSDHALAADL